MNLKTKATIPEKKTKNEGTNKKVTAISLQQANLKLQKQVVLLQQKILKLEKQNFNQKQKNIKLQTEKHKTRNKIKTFEEINQIHAQVAAIRKDGKL